MKQFLVFIRKEFAHVFRDRKSLLMLFGVPIIQIVLFGFALTNEIKNSKILVVDYAKDNVSQAIISDMEASAYFDIEKTALGEKELEATFRKGTIKAAVVFPVGFANDVQHFNKGTIQIIADASDPNTATSISNYLTAIIGEYQSKLLENKPMPYRIDTNIRMLYNPELRGATNFVPGVMALVLMLICTMMTSISIAREKELGTMEILLVSPFRPLMVIISKAVPYLILSLVNLTIILLISVFVLELPVNGSLALLIAESTLFIVTCLSIGLLISTMVNDQQTAMLISLMGMMLPTVLFTGYMFPIENMPVPLQIISNFVPSRWYYSIVKAVMIKGLGIAAIWKETLVLAAMAIVLLTISLKKFKIRLE